MLPESDVEIAISNIEAAFAGLEPPGDDHLLHPEAMDDVDVLEFYGAPEWQSLPDETMVRCWAAHYFFSAQAFQYYMPAFMVWSLRHADTIDYTPESTIRAFDPGSAGDPLRPFQVSKYALLTDAQIRSVIGFLELFSRDRELGPIAHQALSNYWAAEPTPTAGLR